MRARFHASCSSCCQSVYWSSDKRSVAKVSIRGPQLCRASRSKEHWSQKSPLLESYDQLFIYVQFICILCFPFCSGKLLQIYSMYDCMISAWWENTRSFLITIWWVCPGTPFHLPFVLDSLDLGTLSVFPLFHWKKFLAKSTTFTFRTRDPLVIK